MVHRQQASLRLPYDGKRIPCFYSRPKKGRKFPLVFYIHGGGFSMGSGNLIAWTPIGRALKRFYFVLLSPSYTLMKESSGGFPIQYDECLALFHYALEHAEELHIDKTKIIVAGDSAGGNLCVALTKAARDEGIPILAHLPLYPMLSAQQTSTNFTAKCHFWDGERNQKAWAMYLSSVRGEIPPQASPSLFSDLSNMPPCYTFISKQEPFYQETLDYIHHLQKDGIQAEVDIFDSKYHGFDAFYPFSKNARKAVRSYFAHLSRYLGA